MIQLVEVGETYLLDPESEDLIWGDQLQEGMVVLVDGGYTQDIWTRRWCRVTQMRVAGEVIKFIGVYGDGTKSVRSYHHSFGWFVKKDSVTAGPS